MFTLRPAEPGDAEFLAEVRNGAETYLSLHDAEMYSIASTEAWLRNLPASSRRLIASRLAVWGTTGGEWRRAVIRIDRIDHTNRTCYIGMDIHPQYRGLGLARPIYRELLNYLFRHLNFQTLYLEVLETNTRAVHIYDLLGFRRNGLIPRRVFRDGQYLASIHMSMSQEEYTPWEESS